MKHFTFKWLRRFSVLLAIKLLIIAIVLTSLRILFVSIEDYKEDLASWLADNYSVNLSAANISAGVDLSGLIIILNDIELQDSVDIPVTLRADHLFLHLDFWDSFVARSLSFNRISLQGVDLTLLKRAKEGEQSEQSLPTLNTLQTVLLQQLKQFSIKDSRVHFKNHLGISKTIAIEKLRWLNNGDRHQGVGSASLPESLGDNSLKFVIDLVGEPGDPDNPVQGELYVDADNLKITDYLLERSNANAHINNALLGFQLWAKFSLTELYQAQVMLNDSQLAWSQANKQHNWRLNSGLLQLTNNGEEWLLDSYDLDIEHNQKKVENLAVSGSGTMDEASFDFKALALRNILPFYFLSSNLSENQVASAQALDIDAQVTHLAINKNKDNKLHFSTQLKAFKNRPKGAIPGLSNAHIEVLGDASQGEINITLPKQKIYFDGQFSRAMPVQSGDLALRWLASDAGFKLFSEQSILKTTELDTITEFSLLFPNQAANNKSPFLSLYSYASLNDASKAKHYYPIKAMGKRVYNYLQPTLKKGQVKGAKILWYGALNHYPYLEHDGIFQAWVPLRNAQYDFYGQWQGLSNLDLDLLFENDWLTMDALQASLGKVNVHKLSAKIDHLNPNGILSINADIAEEAQKISDYLKSSPLKESVGKALTVIDVHKKLAGNLQLTIPFNRNKQATQTKGKVTLPGNDINLGLADNLILPLKNVHGQFSFINGNLTANKLTAQLFAQPLQLSFATTEDKQHYQVNADFGSVWDLQQLTTSVVQLTPLQLSGRLDWSGNVDFEYDFKGGYHSRTRFNSAMQGVQSKLPFPFNKNALQSWPTNIEIVSDNNSSTFAVNIKDKLDFMGLLDYQEKQQAIPYFALNIGTSPLSDVDTQKHIINVALDTLDMSDWYLYWDKFKGKYENGLEINGLPSIEVDQVIFDIKHAMLFEQAFSALKVNALNDKEKWSADILSDNLQANGTFRSGNPVRFDLDIKKLNLQTLDFSKLHTQQSLANKQQKLSADLASRYPEVFVQCAICIYGDYDFSPLKLHIYPSKSDLHIDYINIGSEKEFTQLSGKWNQQQTKMSVDLLADKNNSIVKRLGFVSPLFYQQAQLNGAFTWLGAPWQFNLNSLNGDFSAKLKDGAITEVSDKGARLLSLFSLDAIRRSLNLEFKNVFAKGLNFDELTFSGNIDNGIVENDDFYLNGSAGKIVGNGLLDLPNNNSSYEFSYSPAVTSSLPVLTAFAINPLTGAAVLLLSKILEPVVETIVQVDFSVKGPLNEPEVKLINRRTGKVKLENRELLEKIIAQPVKRQQSVTAIDKSKDDKANDQ